MKAYLGIDVQSRRRLSYFVCDDEGSALCSSWLALDEGQASLVDEVYRQGYKIAGVGIDAPRQLLEEPRKWYWNGRSKKWRERRDSEKGFGRHCEVIVSAHGLAKPQWTPLEERAPAWMEIGIKLYEQLEGVADTYEVFPSASYRMLQGETSLTATLDLGQLADGPKDMPDACVAAVTVREFLAGNGASVGDGDSLGEIVLPRRIKSQIQEVFEWPS